MGFQCEAQNATENPENFCENRRRKVAKKAFSQSSETQRKDAWTDGFPGWAHMQSVHACAVQTHFLLFRRWDRKRGLRSRNIHVKIVFRRYASLFLGLRQEQKI